VREINTHNPHHRRSATSDLAGPNTVSQVRSERARRLCLSRLLGELEGSGVVDVTLESRGLALDHRDRQVLTGLRRSALVSQGMRVRWCRPSGEPMLWAADCLARSHGGSVITLSI
jgi:hypothetical protein